MQYHPIVKSIADSQHAVASEAINTSTQHTHPGTQFAHASCLCTTLTSNSKQNLAFGRDLGEILWNKHFYKYILIFLEYRHFPTPNSFVPKFHLSPMGAFIYKRFYFIAQTMRERELCTDFLLSFFPLCSFYYFLHLFMFSGKTFAGSSSI